ncbi:formate dehydrogenase (NAD+) [Tulasnella sp. 330]|nr:formate dehydrogenase (NAD+) [Tulasnella sp. 330]
MHPSSRNMVKVLAVLYKGGKYAQQQPRLLGTIENRLGISGMLKSGGHQYVVTDDKEGPGSQFQKEIVDADVLITTPFHPGYLTRDILAKAKNLKLAITAGVGSDHVDLDAANEHKVTVAEVSGSNVVSVAEHVVMSILLLVRNFVPAHEQIRAGDWDVAAVARNAYDLEGKVVGTLGAGRIGFRVLQRLKPFDCKELLYYDYNPLPDHATKEVGARRVEDLKEFLSQVDVLTVNAPLHDKTKGLINAETLSYMKKGSWIVNTARGAICNADDVAAAVKSGHIAGYAGDVWYPQPAPRDHPWRAMLGPDGNGNGMVAHYSGTTLDAQQRYADGTREILQNWLDGKPQNPANVIVENGDYVTKAYGQRTAGATS